MNTKRLGNIGEAKALAWFTENRFPVSIPFGDNETYDLILDFHGKLLKVQVKTSSIINNEVITFYLRSSRHNREGQHLYTPEEVDLFILYHSVVKQLYAVFPNECGVTLSLRVSGSTAREYKNVREEEEYKIERLLRDVSPLSDKQLKE